jgi:hypothetical protein
VKYLVVDKHEKIDKKTLNLIKVRLLYSGWKNISLTENSTHKLIVGWLNQETSSIFGELIWGLP